MLQFYCAHQHTVLSQACNRARILASCPSTSGCTRHTAVWVAFEAATAAAPDGARSSSSSSPSGCVTRVAAAYMWKAAWRANRRMGWSEGNGFMLLDGVELRTTTSSEDSCSPAVPAEG